MIGHPAADFYCRNWFGERAVSHQQPEKTLERRSMLRLYALMAGR